MNICIFCSAQNVGEKYTRAAQETAALIAKCGHTLVWGGSDVGIMKLIADAAQREGGKLVGVSTKDFHHVARKDADEMLLTENLSERKKIMLERSDALLALPGGLGTLDELAEVMALKRTKFHAKPLVILNVDNFYEGLRLQFKRMHADGFLADRQYSRLEGETALPYFAKTPEEAIDFIEADFLVTGKKS